MMLVLLGAALLCLVAGGGADPPYALTFPALMRSNESSTACVHFVTLTETLDLKVVLQYFETNTTIFEEQISTTEYFKCVLFQVPDAKSTAPVFISLMAHGPTVQIYHRQSVVIAVAGDIHNLQLDKPLYKPGDDVRVRLISVNNALRPVKAKCTSIHLLDPSSNKMFQLLDLASENGVLPFTFPLPSDAELGNYKMLVTMASGETISKDFPVEKKVLPRFAVSLKAPHVITVLDQMLSYEMSARYTYNRGVPGNVTSRLCRGYSSYYPGNACNRNPDGICQTLTGQTDSDGVFSGTFHLSIYQLDRAGLHMHFQLQVTMIEAGTGVQTTESQSIYITNEMARANFDRRVMQQYYKQNLPYLVRLNVLNADGQPLSNETVELHVGGKNLLNLTTGEDGSAEHDIDTSGFLDSTVPIQIIYKNTEQCYDSNWLTPTYANDYFSVTRSYSRSGSYLELTAPFEELSCGKSYDLRVRYALSREGVGEGNATASVSYLIMSRAVIVQHGQQQLDLSSSLNGECSINVPVSTDLAGGADVVVYLMLHKETITDAKKLTVEKCFQHKVSMNFSAEEAIPGSSVDFEISAAPGSICGLKVTDASLSLLKQKQDFTADTVFNSLKFSSLSGYNVAGYNVAPPTPPCIDPKNRLFVDGVYYQPVGAGNEGDSYGVLSSIGLIMVTNTTLHKPEVCGGNVFRPVFHEFGNSATFAREVAFTVTSDAAPSASPVITDRSFFPEVWSYPLIVLGDNGIVTIPETVPGTITTWELSGFCMSADQGIGITKHSSNLTSHLQFFVESSSPYSMVRNEVLVYRAFATNSLDSCIKVGIKLVASEDFTAEMTEGQQDTCICQNERAAYAWEMKPLTIGVTSINVTAWTKSFGATCDGANDSSQPFRQDSMSREVIVEAEGRENEMTYSTLVSLNGQAVEIPIVITPPSNLVQGSLKSSLILTGDLLNLPLKNLQSLIRLPTGCAEQHLAMLMPIASTMKYLQCKGLLTDAIKAEAIAFMEIGYRGQLRYIRPDGSSSVFGGPTSSTSTWLTALTYKTFANMKPYVFIDDAIQNRGLLILERSQNTSSGCFEPNGFIFNRELQGGAEDHISLTAFVVPALIESNYPGGPTVIRMALMCMDAASRTKQSLYNRAMMAYAFTVAGYVERSNALLEELKQEAIVDEDDSIHWELPDKRPPKNVPFFHAPASAASIEITACVLWALASSSNPSQENLTYMASIVRWMVKQMNANGAFRSSADTVVAMEALSAYGCMVHTENATQQVTLSSSDGVIATFNIDQSNSHVLQTLPLANDIQQYNVNVQGNGSCFLQIKSTFNTPVSNENTDFTLSLNTSSDDCDNGVAYLYTITGSGSYQGPGNMSNMALVEIKMHSGYEPVDESIEQLKKKVNMVEVKRNRVIIYLEHLSSEPKHFSLQVQMTDTMLSFQPQIAYLYDYYNPDLICMAVLHHPCAAGKPKET